MSKQQNQGPKANLNIRSPQVRVIDDGKMLGVMTTRDALKLAQDRELDLIEVDPTGNPPICKIMDLGKYKYEQKKREQQSRQNQKKVDTKELKIRPRTEEHDLNVKIKQTREFLNDGDKVRFTVTFHGREMAYKEQGRELLNKVLKSVEDIGKIDGIIKTEGNNMMMLLVKK